MNTIEAKNMETETVTTKCDSSGQIIMRTDSQGRHLYCVTGDVHSKDGTLSPACIFVWALTARDAAGDGSHLYEAKNGRRLYIDRAYMPVH